MRRFKVVITDINDLEVTKFWFGDRDSIEAELERLSERRDNLRSQGREDEADAVHELWCHITTHFEALSGR